jgi:hypothetical protein
MPAITQVSDDVGQSSPKWIDYDDYSGGVDYSDYADATDYPRDAQRASSKHSDKEDQVRL